MKQYEQTTPVAVPYERTTSTPIQQQSLHSHFAVPATQAIFTALAWGAAIGFLGNEVLGIAFVIVFLPAATVSLAISWRARLAHADTTIHRVETITQMGTLEEEPTPSSPSEDGHVAVYNPSEARTEVKRTAKEDEQRGTYNRLITFVEACYTVGTSEDDHGINTKTKRDEYIRFRDVLLDVGLATWRNPENHNVGWDLDSDYDKALRILRKHVWEL